jgi:hypothetical protein
VNRPDNGSIQATGNQTERDAVQQLRTPSNGDCNLQISNGKEWHPIQNRRGRCGRPGGKEPADCLRLSEAALVAISEESCQGSYIWDLLVANPTE